jgi:nucleoside-diphosphate kinase
METTLLFIKPDGVQRGLVGKIITRLEEKGLWLVGLKMMRLEKELAARHYEAHKGKPFYDGLIQYVTSGPIVVMAVQGLRAVEVCRKLMGATFGYQADPGTIRGDFGISGSFNLIHGSDAPEAAERELALYFRPDELCPWESALRGQVYDIDDELS